MAVAPQALDHRAARADGHPAALLQLGEVPVVDARKGLRYHPRRAGSETVDLGERAGCGPLGEFGLAQSVGDLHGPLKGSHLGRGSKLAVQVVHGKREGR